MARAGGKRQVTMGARTYVFYLMVAGVVSLMLSAIASPVMAAKPPSQSKLTALDLQGQPMMDDFDRMLERRGIRILVPYSRTLFFNDRGAQRGLTADILREFERWLNEMYKTGSRPLTVLAIPVTRDQLFPKLLAGYGDLVAGNLTITDARQGQVNFSSPIAEGLSEVVVTGPASPLLRSLDDLAGQEVHVRRSSSYYESLAALNERFSAEGKPVIALRLVPDALEDEDMMEMLNAGLIRIMVVDQWKADLWAQVLRKITVHRTMTVRTGVKVGWAMRKDTPKLAEVVNEFITFARGNKTAAQRLAAYHRRFKQMKNATEGDAWKKFKETIALFHKYGERYGFDHLMVAAQGYQESLLDQSARSPVGAIGIMQLMPATGNELAVGDIHLAEPNVHGGIKYMRRLIDYYFRDANFDEQNRTLFAFASYNAGPGRIAKLRREAQLRGLDQDTWLNNVEIVAARRIGQETVQYVRNIYKYYIAYRLQLDTLEMRKAAGEQFR
jgi:membrane-bound lytic murein transglycosylase MltF